jgi:hypothetical protein
MFQLAFIQWNEQLRCPASLIEDFSKNQLSKVQSTVQSITPKPTPSTGPRPLNPEEYENSTKQ